MIPLSPCPHCGYEFDAATMPGEPGATPASGDLSVCIECAGLLVFNDDLTVRAMPDAEWESLPTGLKMTLYKARVGIRAINKRKGSVKRKE